MYSLWFILAILLINGLSIQNDQCSVDLGSWLNCNNPRVIQYLSALSDAQIGSTLKGIKLTDGSYVAKGYHLLALPKDLDKGIHVVVVQRSNKMVSEAHTADGFVPEGRGAFVWVDIGGEPLVLPDCFTPLYENQYVLSGDIFTYKAVQPGHGVVEIGCIDPSWMTKN